MSPSSWACVICGQRISSQAEPDKFEIWSNEFRMVYKEKDDDAIKLSGVGRSPSSELYYLTPPLGIDARWDDPSPIEAPHISFGRLDGMLWGFSFHVSCQKLFMKAKCLFGPNLRNWEWRLFQICESFRRDRQPDRLILPHAYGGIEEATGGSENFSWQWHHSELADACGDWSFTAFDPWTNPELSDCITRSRLKRNASELEPRRSTDSTTNSSQQILRKLSKPKLDDLPWDILETVGCYLQIADVTRLRLASRAFRDLLQSQRFWASRFSPGFERDYVFEAKESDPVPDWHRLFHMTDTAHEPPGLKNRRRIWICLRYLTDILRVPAEPVSDTSSGGFDDGQSKLCWQEVRESLIGRDHSRYRKQLWSHSIQIPSQAKRLAISCFTFGTQIYVTGLRFYEGCEELRVGYIAACRETQVSISELRGFVIALAPEGICALQVNDSVLGLSHWIGKADGLAVTLRIAGQSQLQALRVGFDVSPEASSYRLLSDNCKGFKIVSVAGAWEKSPSIVDQGDSSSATSRGQLDWRSQALWSPYPPGESCIVNESFQPLRNTSSMDTVFQFCSFGGHRGDLLRSLTAIRFAGREEWHALRFDYVEADAADNVPELGQGTWDWTSPETLIFPIDGPGGEYITSVEISRIRTIPRRTKDDPETLFDKAIWLTDAVRISTNRNRSVVIPDPLEDPPLPEAVQCGQNDDSRWEVEPMEPLACAPDTIITGLFRDATKPHYGFQGLGIVYENLPAATDPRHGHH